MSMRFKRGMNRIGVVAGLCGLFACSVLAILEYKSVSDHISRAAEYELLIMRDDVRSKIREIKDPNYWFDIGDDGFPTPISLSSPLPEERRKQLDSIVLQMESAGASERDVRLAVADFKHTHEPPGGPVKTLRLDGHRLNLTSIETQDGRILFPEKPPSKWNYVLLALLPFGGFLLPWGSLRAFTWIVSGFFDDK